MAVLAGALAAHAPPFAADDHSHHQHPQHKADDSKPTSVKLKYDDAVLTDESGRQVKFKTDVMADWIVVVDFVFTTRTTVCPWLTALMAKVQGELGEKDMTEVQFVSITVDPARDTPARMKEYAGRYGAKPGWVWPTGPTGRGNDVLNGFGAYAPNFEDHPPLVPVGDARTGSWTRFFGPSFRKCASARGGASAAAHRH